MRLADTIACELAQNAWAGMDAPAAEPTVAMLRKALADGLPGEVSLDDVGEWCHPQLAAVTAAPNFFALEQRVLRRDHGSADPRRQTPGD